MSLPLLPIHYEDGRVDLAVSVPLWYRDAALDLLSRMVDVLQFNEQTIGWCQDICAEVIVSNRREKGINWDAMGIQTKYELFLTKDEASLFWLIQQNNNTPVPPQHLLEGTPADASPLPIANILSLILTDQRLAPQLPILMEMDAGTAFGSIYHSWSRLEPPDKRKARKQYEFFSSDEYQQSDDGRQLEALYQARLNKAKQRREAYHANSGH